MCKSCDFYSRNKFVANLQILTFKKWQCLILIQKASKSFGWGRNISNREDAFMCKSCDFYSKNNQDKTYDSHSWFSNMIYYSSGFLRRPQKIDEISQ